MLRQRYPTEAPKSALASPLLLLEVEVVVVPPVAVPVPDEPVDESVALLLL